MQSPNSVSDGVVTADRLIRLPECERLSSIRKSYIYALMAKEPPEFPRCRRITPRYVAWSEAAVLRWVQERMSGTWFATPSESAMSPPRNKGASPAAATSLHHFRDLLQRATDAIRAQAQYPIATFVYFDSGEERRYRVRMEWSPDRELPRLVVYEDRNALFCCQSVDGDWKKVDPERLGFETCGYDEYAQLELQDHQAALAKSPGPAR